MRIRSILPNFYRSEDVGAMDWDTRLLFIGLWSYVDDNGVGRDVAKLIVADLFPFDDSHDALARVSRGLQTLSEGGQITRYTIDEKPFLFVNKWDTYQRIDRPAKARYERPTCDDAVIRDTLATPSRQSPDTLATGEGEKGRRGEGERVAALARPDVDELCDLLADLIEGNGSKRPTITKAWRNAARLMLDTDDRPLTEAKSVLRWSQGSDFWKSNILSMPKLREKYDTLRLQARRDGALGGRDDDDPYAHFPQPKDWEAIKRAADASRGLA